jgi:putative ABC transport system permease protein
MAVPVIVTVVSALIGNILGYTVMKNVAADMYYASYSLPVYVTVWNADAFIRTTIIPILIMIAITSLTLQRQLRRSPLLFLRGDLSSQRRSRAFFLPHALPIMTKYRMRILLQNAGSYLVLFVGILFSNLLLMFGMQLPALMTNFQAVIDKDMIASYQYILNIPLSLTDSSAMKTDQLLEYMEYASSVSTENPTAEKFSVYTLKTEEVPGSRQDQVMIYGIRENSCAYVGPIFNQKTTSVGSYTKQNGSWSNFRRLF